MSDTALVWLILVVAGAAGGFVLRARLRTPVRHHTGPQSVGQVYDAWTEEGVLETYWGEHLHVGYYGAPAVKKDFIPAKLDLVDEVIRWGITDPHPAVRPARILDLGCGIGGSARHLARRWTDSLVTGVTISRHQARRATSLSRAQGVRNTAFIETNALHLPFPDATFDIVWAMESETHMANKPQFASEIVRVMKPGGALVLTAWNVRETGDAPLTPKDVRLLRLVVDEWCHAPLVSIRYYVELFTAHGLREVVADDWTEPTLPSWREAILEGIRRPRILFRLSPSRLWSMTRDAYTMRRLQVAFKTGLCRYGVFRGRKGDDREAAS